MKIQTLRVLTVSLAACLAPAAFASVSINGESFDSFKLSSTSTGGVILTTVPSAVVVNTETNLPVAIPELTPDFSISVASQTGEMSITLPDDIQPVNCSLPDSTANNPIACPPGPPPPPPGQCGDVGAELVFETIPWAKIPGKTTVTTGKKVAASKFTTTTSATYKGYFSAVADSASGHLTRRMWFSECPGGEPIVQNYRAKVGTSNACDVTGVELKLSWTQESQSAYVTTCKLERNKTYYLNHSQAAFGSGIGPSATSKLFRGSSKSGTP